MPKLYRDTAKDGFGKPKPLKRPVQARSKFTVQAIYDAFVRIWRTDGWAGVTTRAVALETGISVGTFYDFFPDKEALLSGYVRHCVEALLARIEAEAITPQGLDAAERIGRLVRITCNARLDGLPVFDHEMLMLEHRIAEPKHHRRVYDELAAAWARTFAACPDLRPPPSAATVQAMLLACWGARRYHLLVQPDGADDWVSEIEAMVLGRVNTASRASTANAR